MAVQGPVRVGERCWRVRDHLDQLAALGGLPDGAGALAVNLLQQHLPQHDERADNLLPRALSRTLGYSRREEARERTTFSLLPLVEMPGGKQYRSPPPCTSPSAKSRAASPAAAAAARRAPSLGAAGR